MPDSTALSSQIENTPPAYIDLLKFLVEPFLDQPESLSIDCEELNNHQRVWIRVAFEGKDKGRVFGRGGRNIQAIRTVLKIAAASASQTLYLDIYDNSKPTSKISKKRENGFSGKQASTKQRNRPSTSPKLSVKPRS